METLPQGGVSIHAADVMNTRFQPAVVSSLNGWLGHGESGEQTVRSDCGNMTVNSDRIDPKSPQLGGTIPEQSMLPVAQYVRMSTERQCYSTENQMELIANYAHTHGMGIVRSFSDEGKSGITLRKRPGLLSLLSVVQNGSADFKAILVYDVSRWGRFQDIDESGYWEYVCKRAGVVIHYCAEPFINDGSTPSVIIKSLKRTMAAEYSRELSVKCFAGQCRLIELGYRQGGRVGYGLRRLLLDQEDRPKQILLDGQQKSIQSDRVVLVPGPEEEQRVIREIFHLFIDESKSQSGIAKELNARGVPSGKSRPWCYPSVHDILVNPKYMGANVFNRTSVKFHGPKVHNPEQLWIRKEGAFPAIVPRDLFLRAAKILEERRSKPTDDEMLDQLRSTLSKKGRLTATMINECISVRKASFFFKQFGGLRGAYTRLGYISPRDLSFLDCNPTVRAIGANLLNAVTSRLNANGAIVEKDRKSCILRVNRDFSMRLAVARCLKRPNGRLNWRIPKRASLCDLNIVARLNEDNTRILDYFIFPANEHPRKNFFLSPKNSVALEFYRFESLDHVYQACRRKRVGD